MSFLPHAPPRAVSWYGSFAASFMAHLGLVVFVLFSGVVILTPSLPDPQDTPDITVSLEILDANIVEDLAPVDDTNLVPEDAVITDPEAPEVENPEDIAALTPDDQEVLAPDDEALLAPEVEETLQPEVTEPDPIEPEVAQPEVIAPAPVEPDVAEIEPEADEPLLVPEEVIAPEPAIQEPQEQVAAPLPTPPVEQPFAIDDLSPIDDTVLNPLATGGSGVAPVDDFALLAPEPQQPETSLLQPDPVDNIAPIVLPDAQVDAPTVIDPEPETPPEPDVIADPEPETPDITETPDPEAAPDPEADPGTQTARAPLANPSASEIAIGQLLRRIRATPQEQCTLALPRRVGGDSALAGLAMVGAREDQLDALATRITDGLDFTPVQTRELLDPRQCATLDALRQSDSYPANRIGLSLDRSTLSSGDQLTGRIVGGGGLYVTLLLVDDNGVVQDLAPFITLVGSTPVFEAPIARAGPSRATRQVLLAIGTPDAPLDLSDRIGQVAQDVFGQIPAETLQNMVFGIATFDVQ